jgi:hypothetical protein
VTCSTIILTDAQTGRRLCLNLGNIAAVSERQDGCAMIYIEGYPLPLLATQTFEWMVARWTEYLDWDEYHGNVPDEPEDVPSREWMARQEVQP